MSATAQTIDQAKLDEFMGRFVGDLGAAVSAALVVIGDRLGLYRAMADGEPVSASELAARTGTDPRYVQEWLCNQAAGGYVGYDPAGETFFLTPEQSLALAQEGSPAFVPGAFQLVTAVTKDEEKIADAFVDATASAGMSTTTTCSAAPSGSSAPVMPRTLCRHGSPRSRASRRNCTPGLVSPTSAAGTERRRS